MKKIISVFAMILVFAVTVSANTEIWSNIQNTGGLTQYREQTWVSGLDWSENAGTTLPSDYGTPEYQTTAYVDFSLENDNGAVGLSNYIDNPRGFEMVKMEVANGFGDTNIQQTFASWTEDKKVSLVTGNLKYPTESWGRVEFQTDELNDLEDVHFLMDKPFEGEQGDASVFEKIISTDSAYSFMAKQGVNIYPCTYTIPEAPSLADPHANPAD